MNPLYVIRGAQGFKPLRCVAHEECP
jgi:hypothetical protein